MISLFSLNEPGEKSSDKHIFNPKKPALWIIIASVVLISAAIIFLPNTLKTPAVSEPSEISSISASSYTIIPPVPYDITLFEMKMDGPDDSYITEFESNNEMLYDWITDAEQLYNYAQTLYKRFDASVDLNTTLLKYNAEYFASGVLMPIILRSDSNVSCFYTGHSVKNYAGYSFAENYGLVQSFTFSIGTPSLTFDLEYSRLKNDGYNSVEPTWWISLVEFRKTELKGLPLHETPILIEHSDRGNTDQVALRYEEINYNNYGNHTESYMIVSFDNQEKMLFNDNMKHLTNGFDYIFIPRIIGVQQSDGWRLLNRNGLLISNYVYTELKAELNPNFPIDEQQYMAKRNGKWVLLRGYNGFELTYAIYDKILLDYSNGIPAAISVIQNGKYGAISKNGNVLVSAIYDFITVDGDQIYILKDHQWGLVTVNKYDIASEIKWSVQIPENIMTIYTYFTKPVYEMTDFETQILDWFSHNNIFYYLASETGEISDLQIQVYATHFIPNYDCENGNTRTQYNIVTMKYFGKILADYTDNTMFELVPKTDLIRPTGWSIDDGPNIILISAPLQKEGDVYTGLFNCYYLNDRWDDALYSREEIEQMIYKGEMQPFVQYGCDISTLEIKFSLDQEKDGSYYPIFHSVKYNSPTF